MPISRIAASLMMIRRKGKAGGIAQSAGTQASPPDALSSRLTGRFKFAAFRRLDELSDRSIMLFNNVAQHLC